MAKTEPNKPGRKTKLTEEVKKQLLEWRSCGISLKRCAYGLNVDETTVYRWMKQDPALRQSINHIAVTNESRCLKRIFQGDKGSNGARQWLALTAPEHYSEAALQRAVDKLDREENQLELDGLDELIGE